MGGGGSQNRKGKVWTVTADVGVLHVCTRSTTEWPRENLGATSSASTGKFVDARQSVV